MNQIKERDYFWDNMKAVLITLVVVGHVLEMSTLLYAPAHALDVFIYSFHMPAFLFVSGFFAKRYCVDGKVRAEKVATLAAYYIIFELLFTLTIILTGSKVNSLTIFMPRRGLWYLLVLVYYYLITPLLEKLPAWLTLPLAVLFAVLVANDKLANTYFSIMRAFTFAPYFIAGYYISGGTVSKLRSLKAYVRYPVAAVCTLSSVAIWAAMYILKSDLSLRALFYGKSNNFYREISLGFGEAAMCRLLVYVIAFLMIAALLLAVPSKKSIIAKVGQNSLQIFVLHMFLVVLLFDTKTVKFNINSLPTFILCVLLGLAVTAVLSLWFFGYPFKWIQNGVYKLCSLRKKQ